jgi:integrase
VTTLDKVTLQTHLNSIAQGYSTSVVAHVSAMIKSMCAELVETDLLMKNPARSLKIPKVKAEENRVLGYGQDFFLDGKPYLSAQQLTALLSKVEGKDRLVVMLAGLLGMRGGEIAGLTGDAYTGMDLAIIRRVYRGVVDSVKTKSSTALLPVPKIIRESLDKFKCAPGTFIFGYKSGKPLDRDYFLQSVLIPVSTLAELPFVANFQVLRRSFATLFESFGATYSEVETMMRHSKRDIHLVYVQARRESILQKLDTMCEEIAGNLPEHVEIPVESSRETSQVFAIT